MSKAVMISIQPKWCELMARGIKTIEVRKSRPKLEPPFKCYIYCTQAKNKASVDGYAFFADELYIDHCSKTLTCGHTQFEEIVNGKVIGEFVCDGSEILFNTNGNPPNYIAEILPDILKRAAMTFEEFQIYVNGRAAKNSIYGWHISDLVIYDRPKELSEFSIVDNVAVKNCKHRIRAGQPEYMTANGGWIYGTYGCMKESSYDPDLCTKCKTKPLEKPPQSWCYVEENIWL